MMVVLEIPNSLSANGVFMTRNLSLLCSASLLVAIAACDNSTGPSNVLSQSEVNQLASDMDAVSTVGAAEVGFGSTFSLKAGGSSASVPAAVIAINNQFTVTHQCPRGGQVVIAGTVTGVADPTARNLALEAAATRADTDCAFQTKNGTLTVNGNPNIAYDGRLNVFNAAFEGLQTQTLKGSFKWARVGGSGTCDVDIASAFDPSSHTVTVTGTFCGLAVNATRTRTN
jgi:hypothetical protein